MDTSTTSTLGSIRPQVRDFAREITLHQIDLSSSTAQGTPTISIYQGQECVVKTNWNNVEIRTVDAKQVESENVRTLRGHTNFVSSVAMSPDGQYVVSGSWDHSVRVWSLQTSQCVATLQGHTSDVESVAVSPDGQHVVSGSGDGTVRVWVLLTGQCMTTLRGHLGLVSSVAVSPDGQHIVSGSWDYTVRVWTLLTGQYLRTLHGHTRGVFGVAVSPDGQHIVSGGWDNTVRLWSLPTGQCMRTLQGHSGNVRSVAVSPDGQHIVSGSYDKTVRLWSPQTGQCVATIEEEKVTSFTLSIARWHDGTEIGMYLADRILYVMPTVDRARIDTGNLKLLCNELLQCEGIINRINRSTPLLSALVQLDMADQLRSVLLELSSQSDGTIPNTVIDARGKYQDPSSVTDFERPTALHYALMLGRSECAQLLLEHGASIHACQLLKMPGDKLLSISEQ